MQLQEPQAKLFFFAATKIRIGRRRSLPLRKQQAEPFFFAATKFESDAELFAAKPAAGETILLCRLED